MTSSDIFGVGGEGRGRKPGPFGNVELFTVGQNQVPNGGGRAVQREDGSVAERTARTLVFGTPSQERELAAITAGNPQAGISDFADFVNSELDRLFSEVENSRNRLTALFNELESNPQQIANDELLTAIEEFVELSKFSLVTYKALKVKVDRVFTAKELEDSVELSAIRDELIRVLTARLDERLERHEDFGNLVASIATESQQKALLDRVFTDLGVEGENAFDAVWARGERKFVTLPEENLNFLRNFEKILVDVKLEIAESRLPGFEQELGKGRNGRKALRTPTFGDTTVDQNAKDPWALRAGRSIANFFRSIKHVVTAPAGYGKIAFAQVPRAHKVVGGFLAGAILAATGAGIYVSSDDGTEVAADDTSSVSKEAAPAQSVPMTTVPEANETINPLTGKPFSSQELEFLAWVDLQISQGNSADQVNLMMINLVASMQNQPQVFVDIGDAVVQERQANGAPSIVSKRVGGNASTKAQTSARSRAAQRNAAARTAAPATTSLPNAPVGTTPATVPADPTPTPTTVPADPTPTPTTVPADPTPTPTTVPADPTPTPTTVPVDPTPTPTTVPADPTPTTVPASPTTSIVSAPQGLERLSLTL